MVVEEEEQVTKFLAETGRLCRIIHKHFNTYKSIEFPIIEIVTDTRQDSELLGFWTSPIVHPVILSVTHHRQNPSESTCTTGMDTAYALPLVN
jgi:hypothetical protein